MPRSRYPFLSADQLNRATLARQLLLERVAIQPTTAIERIGGLQAQEPASPYLALWSRLEAFDPAAVDRAFQRRRLVKATLMRSTLHVVTRDDYLRLLPATLPMLRGLKRRGQADGARRRADGVARRGRRCLCRPAALQHRAPRPPRRARRRHPAGRRPVVRPAHVAWVHVPSAVPWSFGRRPVLIAASAWLGEGFVRRASPLPWSTWSAGISAPSARPRRPTWRHGPACRSPG